VLVAIVRYYITQDVLLDVDVLFITKKIRNKPKKEPAIDVIDFYLTMKHNNIWHPVIIEFKNLGYNLSMCWENIKSIYNLIF
jgi:hypothetical protein